MALRTVSPVMWCARAPSSECLLPRVSGVRPQIGAELARRGRPATKSQRSCTKNLCAPARTRLSPPRRHSPHSPMKRLYDARTQNPRYLDGKCSAAGQTHMRRTGDEQRVTAYQSPVSPLISPRESTKRSIFTCARCALLPHRDVPPMSRDVGCVGVLVLRALYLV